MKRKADENEQQKKEELEILISAFQESIPIKAKD